MQKEKVKFVTHKQLDKHKSQVEKTIKKSIKEAVKEIKKWDVKQDKKYALKSKRIKASRED